MKKTSGQIRTRLLECVGIFIFEYIGIRGAVEPYSQTCFELYCGDETTSADSVDKVMNLPFFGGKCLNEIADKIEIEEW